MTGYSEYENKLIIGSCSIMLIKFGCQSVPELPSKIIHSLEDKYYCVKRDNFSYYENYEKNIYDSDCPKNMKNCGEVDTLHNYLCIDSNTNCPLNFTDKNQNYIICYIKLYQ